MVGTTGRGDVLFMTSFHHAQPNMRVSYKAPAGRVAVFLLLGDVDKKDPFSFDDAGALKAMGWAPVARLVKELDYDKERAAFERRYPMPEGFRYENQGYYGEGSVRDFSLDQYNEMWNTWCWSAQARDEVW